MGKKSDLSDFEHGVVFDISWAGCVFLKLLIYSNFSHKIISRIYRDWSEREKRKRRGEEESSTSLTKWEIPTSEPYFNVMSVKYGVWHNSMMHF